MGGESARRCDMMLSLLLRHRKRSAVGPSSARVALSVGATCTFRTDILISNFGCPPTPRTPLTLCLYYGAA